MTPGVRRARNAVAVIFTGLGFASGSSASRIPQIRAGLHVSPGVLGLILLFGAAGSGISVPLTGIAIARFGAARVVAAAAATTAIGLSAVAVGYEHGIPAVAAGLFGFGAGAGDVAMNVQGTVAVGVTLAMATRGFLPDNDPNSPPARATRQSEGEQGQVAGKASRRSSFTGWTESRTLLIGLFVLCVTVIEGMGNSWLSLGVIDGYRASAVLGGTALSLFLAAMTAGRWFGPRAIDRFGRVSVLRTGTVVALAGVLLIGFGHYLPVALAGAAPRRGVLLQPRRRPASARRSAPIIPLTPIIPMARAFPLVTKSNPGPPRGSGPG